MVPGVLAVAAEFSVAVKFRFEGNPRKMEGFDGELTFASKILQIPLGRELTEKEFMDLGSAQLLQYHFNYLSFYQQEFSGYSIVLSTNLA